ncbi:MAG: hypothetical protein KAT83_01960 [Candidatus Aenigmarchaeota archaeon]|nr:hypothetical protein [Candidatus Aenigmarchaeota archaeon]
MLNDLLKAVGIIFILLILLVVFVGLTTSEKPQSITNYQKYQSPSNYESTKDATGYATKNYRMTDARCNEIKSLCNEALGEYALYKAQESTYTKYESNRKLYYEIIQRYEEEIFPKCKEQLATCK